MLTDHRYSDASVLVYLALANHPGDVAGWIRKPQTHLARYLGWATTDIRLDSATKRIQRAVHPLVRDGWIKVRYVREGLHKVPLYRITPRPAGEGWEAIPRTIFKAVTDSSLAKQGATLMRHWAFWRMSAGPAGWISPTVTRIARTYRLKVDSVKRRLDQLLDLGWITKHEGASLPALRFPQDPQLTVGQEPPAGSAQSVQNPHADPDPEVSTGTAPKCPASSTHVPHQPLDTRSVGASATTVQSVPHPPATAAKPPTTNTTAPKKPRRHRDRLTRDHHATAARHLVNHQPHLKGTPRLLRLQMINLLARQSRLRTTRGEPLDWTLAATYIHQRFEAATLDDTLTGNECHLTIEALANMRADTLAATPTTTRGTLLQPSAPAPTTPAPTLEELRSRPHPATPCSDDEIYDWSVWWLATVLLDAHGKGKDPAATLPTATKALTRVLHDHCTTVRGDWLTWLTEIQFAASLVERSLESTGLAAAC